MAPSDPAPQSAQEMVGANFPVADYGEKKGILSLMLNSKAGANSLPYPKIVTSEAAKGHGPRAVSTVSDAVRGRRKRFLPSINSRAFPEKLTQIDQRSVSEGILHFCDGEGNSPIHHILLGGVKAIVEHRDFEKATPLRKILQISGYGFSTLYKIWPVADELFKDIWVFSIEAYMASELEHLRQLGRDSPESFMSTWATHAVLAQQCVPPLLFSIVVNKFYNNDVLQMLDHVPGHVEKVLDLYDEYFGEDPSTPMITDALRKSLTHSIYLVGTYLFVRNCKPKDPCSDQATIESIRSLLIPYLSRRS